MAEWLRRLTRNQIPSGSVGSSPTDRENILLLLAKILASFFLAQSFLYSNYSSYLDMKLESVKNNVIYSKLLRYFFERHYQDIHINQGPIVNMGGE